MRRIAQIVHQSLRYGSSLKQHRECWRIERRYHIHVDHAIETIAIDLTQRRNILLAAMQTLFFTAKQEEAQIVLDKLRCQDTANLKDACCTTAVVVGTRCICCDAARGIH